MVLSPMIFALSLVTPVIEMLVSVTEVISDQQLLELFLNLYPKMDLRFLSFAKGPEGGIAITPTISDSLILQ